MTVKDRFVAQENASHDRDVQAIEWAVKQRGRRPIEGRPVRQVLARLLTDRNYTAVQGREQLVAAWNAAVGSELAEFSTPGRIVRGALQVVVEDSATMQEIMFRQVEIVEQLQQHLSGVKISRLRCRLGRVR